MTKKHVIQIFEDKRVRTVWDDEQQKWYFSLVDVCGVLTDQPDYDRAKNYWKVTKSRLIKEGNESVTKCNQLKLVSPKDGKRYSTDVADAKLLFRVIQSIPSKKAEPFKQWMAESATTDLSKEQNPQGYTQSAKIAKKGGSVAKAARDRLESQLGHSVISPEKASDYLPPADRCPSLPEDTDKD